MRKLVRPEKHLISLPTNKIEEVKAQLCYLIIKTALNRQMNGKVLAFRLGVSPSTVSRINRHRFDEISLNQLFAYLEVLCPRFKLLISP